MKSEINPIEKEFSVSILICLFVFIIKCLSSTIGENHGLYMTLSLTSPYQMYTYINSIYIIILVIFRLSPNQYEDTKTWAVIVSFYPFTCTKPFLLRTNTKKKKKKKKKSTNKTISPSRAAFVLILFVCLFVWFGLNVAFNNLSVISRRCLDVTGSF